MAHLSVYVLHRSLFRVQPTYPQRGGHPTGAGPSLRTVRLQLIKTNKPPLRPHLPPVGRRAIRSSAGRDPPDPTPTTRSGQNGRAPLKPPPTRLTASRLAAIAVPDLLAGLYHGQAPYMRRPSAFTRSARSGNSAALTPGPIHTATSLGANQPPVTSPGAPPSPLPGPALTNTESLTNNNHSTHILTYSGVTGVGCLLALGSRELKSPKRFSPFHMQWGI